MFCFPDAMKPAMREVVQRTNPRTLAYTVVKGRLFDHSVELEPKGAMELCFTFHISEGEWGNIDRHTANSALVVNPPITSQHPRV